MSIKQIQQFHISTVDEAYSYGRNFSLGIIISFIAIFHAFNSLQDKSYSEVLLFLIAFLLSTILFFSSFRSHKNLKENLNSTYEVLRQEQIRLQFAREEEEEGQ